WPPPETRGIKAPHRGARGPGRILPTVRYPHRRTGTNQENLRGSSAMAQFDGLRPARLKVGVISAGRVGTALGVALERADHVVVACSAISEESRRRARDRLADTLVLPAPDVAGAAELLVLAVPDTELAGIVSGLAATGAVRAGTIV